MDEGESCVSGMKCCSSIIIILKGLNENGVNVFIIIILMLQVCFFIKSKVVVTLV